MEKACSINMMCMFNFCTKYYYFYYAYNIYIYILIQYIPYYTNMYATRLCCWKFILQKHCFIVVCRSPRKSSTHDDSQQISYFGRR